MFPIAPLFSLLPLGLLALQSHDRSPVGEGIASTCLESVQLAKLTSSDPANSDEFGFSVAVSGTTALFGVPDGIIPSPITPFFQRAGVALVFESTPEGAWQEVRRLSGTATGNGDQFGCSVAISGDTIVVGALEASIVGTCCTGTAFVFERNHGGTNAWGQVARLTSSDPQLFQWFGESVSVSGDTIVVGAELTAHSGFNTAGAAYVFERDHGGPGAWGEVKMLTASDAEAGFRFGSSVAISGDTIIVGAFADDSAGTNSGSAYVFERNAGSPGAWNEVQKLTASDAAVKDAFGTSVALWLDTAVIGAPKNDDVAPDSGSAYVFERNPGGASAWVEVRKLTASDAGGADWFGFSVAVSGDRIVIGAHQDDNVGGTDAGAAYVFELDQGGPNAWGEVAKLTALDAESFDSLGYSVATSKDAILVGSPRDDCDCIDLTPSDLGLVPFTGEEGSGYVYGISPALSSVITRHEGTNPLSYSASTAVLGGTLRGTCDLTTTHHSLAWFFAFDAPTSIALGSGPTLLCIDTGSGELFSGGGLGPFPGPAATFSLPVPNDSSLCGRILCSQAVHVSPGPFALSNSQDIRIGSGG